MTFDDVLVVLMGLIGHQVEVAISSPAGGLIAHLRGELAHGHDLTAQENETQAPVFFSFAEDAATGFIIDPRAFKLGASSADDVSLRIEDRAGVVIVVERQDLGRSAETR